MALPWTAVYVLSHYAVLKSFNVLDILNRKDMINEEILKRYSYTDESCRDCLLGGSLRFYEFPQETIDAMLAETKEKFKHVHDGNPDYGK